MLPVLVTDKKGNFIDGLTKNDFVVRVGEARVDFDTFERDQTAPVSFAFLLDTSGSMGLGSKLENAKNAIRSILRNRLPGDDFALFVFSEGQVRLVTESSADPARLLRDLWDLEASGQTALFDAVAATPAMMKGRNNKRAILLFTDGVDNASELSAAQMAEILQRVSVPVYPVGMKNASFDAVKDADRRELSVENLQLLAGSSGGRMHLVDLQRGPPAVFAGVCPVGQGRRKIPDCFRVRGQTRFLGRPDTSRVSRYGPRGIVNVFCRRCRCTRDGRFLPYSPEERFFWGFSVSRRALRSRT
jgi:VWFA-related protein